MSQPPHLTLHISHSPLLSDISPHLQKTSDFCNHIGTDDLLSALLTKRTLNDMAWDKVFSERSPYHAQLSRNYASLHSFTPSSSRDLIPASRSVSEMSAQHQPTNRNKPLPALPTDCMSRQSIISILHLLDALDVDAAVQVSRVNDAIRETRQLVDAYKQKHGERTLLDGRIEWEIREAKEVSGDYWTRF